MNLLVDSGAINARCAVAEVVLRRTLNPLKYCLKRSMDGVERICPFLEVDKEVGRATGSSPENEARNLSRRFMWYLLLVDHISVLVIDFSRYARYPA